MEFQEIFTCPFTTPTTCYSAPNPSEFDDTLEDDAAIEFATESHVLKADWLSSEKTNLRENRIHVDLSSRMIPRDSPQLTCIGYSRDADHEALALIDPIHVNEEVLFQDQDSPSRHLLQPSYSNHSGRDDDGVSIVSTTADTPSLHRTPSSQQLPSAKHHRRVSSITTSSLTGTVGSGNSKESAPRHQKTKSELSTGSSIHSGSDREASGEQTPTAGTGGRHRQNPSLGSAESITGEKNTTHSGNKGGNSTKSKSAKKKAKELLRKAKARLIFSERREAAVVDNTDHVDTSEQSEEPKEEKQKPHHALALLDYRPLCPCVAKWATGISTEEPTTPSEDSTAKEIRGVFVGSADDSLLRLYVPSPSDPRSLIPMALPEEHFAVDTPVMALDFCSIQWPEEEDDGESSTDTKGVTMYVLAIACQDGTIQLITWEKGNDKETFSNISSYKLIVDGPLVCVKLHYNPTMSLRVVVGSLCGYVCQLSYNRKGSASSLSPWEGPFMICQGLWNDYLEEEDSILSVDVYENYVAVGTQVGRCILYATRDNENYMPVWYCLLPYSIHGIRIIRNDNLSSNPLRNIGMILSVTTRRSFHLFQALRGKVPLDPTAPKKQDDIDLDGSVQETPSHEVKREKEEIAIAQAVVNETLEDILDKVERNVEVATENPRIAPPRDSDAATIATSTIDTLLDRVSLQSSATVEPGAVAEPLVQSLPEAARAGPQLEYSSSEDEDEAVQGKDDRALSTTDESQDTETLQVDSGGGLESVDSAIEAPSGEETQATETPGSAVSTTSSEEFVLVETPTEEDAKETT